MPTVHRVCGIWQLSHFGTCRLKPSAARRWTERWAGKPLTVKEAIDGCFEARKAELEGEGIAGRWMSPLKVHVIPKIGSYPVDEVDQHVLKDILDPLWHTKTEAAAKELNRMGLVFKHAAALGLNGR
jgi:hypothetical protein